MNTTFIAQHTYTCRVCNTSGDRMRFYRPGDLVCREECYAFDK